MKPTFEELKSEFIAALKDKEPCNPEYKKVLECTTPKELLQIIYNNLNWCVTDGDGCISNSFFEKFEETDFFNSGIANSGKECTGFANSGNRNSGNRNSGNRNSGNWNSGDSNSGNSNSGNWNSGDSNSGNSNSGNWNSGNSNSGNRNSGYSNSGNSNSGNWNSGDSNSGNRNSGYSNSGNRNSGNRNSGDRNSGYRNSGNWNSGDRNSGYSNSGYRNSGNWNSGDSNSGDSNSGYRNSGAFCTDNNPVVFLFNKPTTILVRDWEKSAPYKIMQKNLCFNIWVPLSIMTEKEKRENPKHEVVDGYLKSIPYKEGWANMWNNLNEESKSEFTTLPNFDSDIFFEITGIKI